MLPPAGARVAAAIDVTRKKQSPGVSQGFVDQQIAQTYEVTRDQNCLTPSTQVFARGVCLSASPSAKVASSC